MTGQITEQRNDSATSPIHIPYAGIVLLMGASNSGKSTLIEQLKQQQVIAEHESLSSDQFRKIVGDIDYIDWRRPSREEGEVMYQQYKRISDQAFKVMQDVLIARCRLNKLTVVDATHLQPEDRALYITLGKRYHVPVILIALDISDQTLIERDRNREHPRGRQRVKQQAHQFKRTIKGLRSEGFGAVHVIKEHKYADIGWQRSTNPMLIELTTGIDVIGDIHGCYDEMIELIQRLGYAVDKEGLYRHAEGRKLVSVGDIMSRGPKSLETMIFWQKHLDADLAWMVDSNHGWKIARYLEGRQVTMNHGDEQIIEAFQQYEAEHGEEATLSLKEKLKQMLLSTPSHLVFTQQGVQRVVVTHAGIRDDFIGKNSKRIDDYCRYGDIEGTDEAGTPIRKDWFVDHTSGEWIIWGHDPRPQPTTVHQTINIDQGAVFGGMLTAYRYPEQTFISVKAYADYAQDPNSPLVRWEEGRFAPPSLSRLIDGYTVQTEVYGEVKVRSEFVKTALDTTSHYTIPLEELIYIPPTMTPPPQAAVAENYLEHPAEAIHYYRTHEVDTMIAEKKHMGSRAILLLFRNEQAAIPYIGRPLHGTIYTRTGRAFFQTELEREVLITLQQQLEEAGYFAKYETEFVLMDAEIVPWNLKARELIASQYGHVSEAATMDRDYIVNQLRKAQGAGIDVNEWIQEWTIKQQNAAIFRETFQQYCWDTDGMDGIRIAPFHILAHSTRSHMDQTHQWHMEHAEELAQYSDWFMATEYKVITDTASEQEVIAWWQQLTEDGHEGIVIKPEQMIMHHREQLIQPAIKVRGRKYLHMIYGIDYLHPNNLSRLKQRKTRKKERHALMEFALSVESVERFVRRDRLEQIHECVLAALSLESDAVDPRL
ncbi:polynucleotide kinase-phosphatase [Paenibacillus sp. PsM32]|uniref:polynucleotide kinase-phosphatase n=1 Tax=Paenibacillus sp. PsM32 TaxID=3030536 RepID=UPI00263B21F6|nr:polynucleotide kinase-phosphatase [Paenibacillus sp. PsM32]MDN4617360.1 polynucleotide kinase-phosphatase [Paenibacillus sp. PsM32]